MSTLTIGDPGSASEVRLSLARGAAAPPDTAVDGGDFGSLVVRGASVRGLQHRHYGTVRQDAFATCLSEDGRWVLAAVADGVGSAARSDEGAAFVVRAVLQRLAANGGLEAGELDAEFAFAAASALLVEHSKDRRAADLATTLTVLAVATEPVDGVRTAMTAWIGDSPVWRLRDGDWTQITDVEGSVDGVYDPAVRPLPTATPPRVEHFEVMAGDVVVAMTDGIGTPLLFGPETVGGVLAQWWAQPPAMLDFAAQVGFARRTFTDDRTAVGIWWLP